MIIKYILIAVLLVGCSDVYRYPCQDPANHNKIQCNPPVCEASGTCTKYLIGSEKQHHEE
jgi:hypothetical protein